MKGKLVVSVLALLSLLVVSLSAGPGRAGAKKSCRENCENYMIMCTKKCRQGVMGQGGSKNTLALQKCKQVCGQYRTRCLKRCAKR